MGLEFVKAASTDHFALNSICLATFQNLFQAWNFFGVDGHDDLTTQIVSNFFLLTKGLHCLFAFAAIGGFERAWSIVNSRVQHTGIATRLVFGKFRFFFDEGKRFSWESFEKSIGGR